MGNKATAAKTAVAKTAVAKAAVAKKQRHKKIIKVNLKLDHFGHSSCGDLMLKMIGAYQHFDEEDKNGKNGKAAAFNPNFYRTIGIHMVSALKTIDGTPCNVLLHASNGQERYRTILLPRGGHGAVFYYDCGDQPSFKIVESWLDRCLLEGRHQSFHQSSKEPLQFILVGFNTEKCRVVSAEDAHALVQRCKGLNLTYSEVNVDDDGNIDANMVENMYNAFAARCLQTFANSRGDVCDIAKTTGDKKANRRHRVVNGVKWKLDHEADFCKECEQHFTAVTRRRHHCRICGEIFCNSCSPKKVIKNFKRKERVCGNCYSKEEKKEKEGEKAMEEASMPRIKIVVLGDNYAGRHTMVQRYKDGLFKPMSGQWIGASFYGKAVDGVQLEIWVVGGHEKADALAPLYYRGADAAVLAYNVIQKDSAENREEELKKAFPPCSKVSKWHHELSRHGDPNMLTVIAALACDCETDEARLRLESNKKFAAENGLSHFETSAKTGHGVDELFSTIIRTVMDRRKEKSE